MALATRDDLLYGPPPENIESPHRAPPGRICDVHGCGTILSSYNPSASCWVHARPEYTHASSRRRAPWEARRDVIVDPTWGAGPPPRSSDG